ncbi:MAG TPA: ferrochelatase [Gammaproteobacteria bacterium]|nr:ferrochelatase [Gammaproteobacteria bacterium]
MPVGVLLVNLGTPDAPDSGSVRRFLAEFLADPRVIELPAALRWMLLHGVVLRLRPRRTARAYRRIWREDGSPLAVFSGALCARLREVLAERTSRPITLRLAMRYGNPGLREAFDGLVAEGVSCLIVLPLYPQYSAATTASAFDAFARAASHSRRLPSVHFVSHYHDDPRYLAAVAASVSEAGERDERLLFSFHGMPQATRVAGDPYYDQCQGSARLIAQSLGLAPDQWAVAFQSRFGRAAWLSPATDAVLRAWAREGVKSVSVVCPGFAVDCLETLEEVALRYREVFLSAGGERFHYIPALNDRPDHAHALAELILRELERLPASEA